jgi:hypothetical protein
MDIVESLYMYYQSIPVMDNTRKGHWNSPGSLDLGLMVLPFRELELLD